MSTSITKLVYSCLVCHQIAAILVGHLLFVYNCSTDAGDQSIKYSSTQLNITENKMAVDESTVVHCTQVHQQQMHHAMHATHSGI